MSTASILPPLDPPELAAALVELRDHADELAEGLKALFIDSGPEGRIDADDLDPLVNSAMILAATVDAVQQRMTGQPMTTELGRGIEAFRWARAHGLK